MGLVGRRRNDAEGPELPCSLTGKQGGAQATFFSAPPPASSWVILGLRGIDCMAPSARATPAAQTSPPPRVLPRPSCLQAGKGLGWLWSHWPWVWDKPRDCPCPGDKCSCREQLCHTAVPTTGGQPQTPQRKHCCTSREAPFALRTSLF